MTDGEVNGTIDGAVETIQPHEILQKGLSDQDSGSEKALGRELFLRRVGFWLALIVFGYILAASIAIFFVSFRLIQIPPLPPPPSSANDAEHYKQLLEAYKQSADVYQQMAKLQVDRAIQLFQLVVASTILPAFTAILGYIFGSRKND
jgi:hypothetical protein